MESYIQAWKLFRASSDENQATAAHICSGSHWPADPLSICDMGCGDGLLLGEILNICRSIREIRLVDPDPHLLSDARTNLALWSQDLSITDACVGVNECWPEIAQGCDIVLAVHLVYLLEPDELKLLLYERPAGAKVFLVLDAPHSVFSELWQWTAAKYYHRARCAHQLLEEILGHDMGVRRSSIRSKIRRSLLLEHDLSNLLLSMLCYRDMVNDVPYELREMVETIIERHVSACGEFIECESYCYVLG